MRKPPPAVRFGPTERQANLEKLASQTFDILVIGGGVTGAAVAWDASLRGFRVALVEKTDFAFGTSSRSSKLIHGGLRYLEQFDFGLVFEALRERQLLIRTASHLIEPEVFLFPIYKGDRTGPFLLRLGLAIYDILAGFRSIGHRRRLRVTDAADVESLLGRDNLRALSSYYDAKTNDARHTVSLIRSAAAAGAVAVNYVSVTSIVKDGEDRAVGARVIDELSAAEFEIRAHLVVNCTGVWTGRVLGMAGQELSGFLHPSKGSHLVFDRERFPVRNSIIFESAVDGRVMFVIPWGWFTLVGTTEVEFKGSPDEVWASPEEAKYLLDSVNALMPEAHLKIEDICATYAGLRPLVAEPGKGAGATSREHTILEVPDNLFSIVGGKYTTNRSMAEELVDRVSPRLRKEFGVGARTGCITDQSPIVGAPPRKQLRTVIAEAEARARKIGLPTESGSHLVRRYGTEYGAIIEAIEKNPALGELLAPPLPYSVAEARYAVEMEMTCTLTDFMARRTHLIYAGGSDNLAVARRAAKALAAPLGWDDAEIERQVQTYAEERMHRRAALGA